MPEIQRGDFAIHYEITRPSDGPTLVVHGGEDPCFGPEHARATSDRIKSAKLWLDPAMGHIMHREQWDELAERVSALAS